MHNYVIVQKIRLPEIKSSYGNEVGDDMGGAGQNRL